MDMNWSKYQEIVKDREAWGSQKVLQGLVTKQQYTHTHTHARAHTHHMFFIHSLVVDP